MGNHVETLRWNGSAIEMIDQRILPHRIEYIACDFCAKCRQGHS